MLVVLDTNLLDRDRELQGKWVRALLEACRVGDIDVAVPDVVMQELVQHQQDDFSKALREVRAGLKSLTAGITDPPSIELPTLGELATTFEARLRGRLSDAGVEILPVPSVSHEELLRRAVEKRHPFSGHDAGYRDALIWHSVLEALQEHDEIIFGTNNSRDFLDDAAEATLSEDLLTDLDSQGVARESVQAATSIEAIVRQHVTDDPLTFIAAFDSQDAVARAEEAFWLFEDRIIEQLEVLVAEGTTEATVAIMSPAQPSFLEMRGAPKVESLDLDDIWTDETNAYIFFTAVVDASLAYGLHHEDPSGMSHDWQGAADTRLVVPASVVFNLKTNDLADPEVDTEETWGVVEDYEPVG